MGSRLRKFVVALLFAAAIPLAALAPSAAATGAANAACPNGTNWDTILQACR
jgi:hypothetical protein